MAKTILKVNNLKKYFKTPNGLLHAVDDVSFEVEEGTTLGVVGESGCGKSTLGRSIIRLENPTSGEVIFKGRHVEKMKAKELRELRQEMQIIFQDPFSSLNPRMTISQAIEEPLIVSGKYNNPEERLLLVLKLMETVGLAQRLVNTYPHELDGGRRQRIGIARALAVNPSFIVCDEPVSALDVSIQAQILNLMKEIQEERGLTYIFITHDLSVVNHFSDEIAVMYLGRIIEKAPSEVLFDNPLHPYTQALLSAIPVPRLYDRGERILIKDEITSPINPKPICRFSERCNYCFDTCVQKEPELTEVEDNHFVACHLVFRNLNNLK